jgi:dolichol-phosphate mannosyltransferase
MKGLIVVVNYNQELEIERFLVQLSAENPGLDVVVVDDGSTDRSPELAERHGYRVLRHQRNRGVGAAIRTGIRHAQTAGKYQYVVVMASNGKMQATDLPRVIGPILAVKGNRFLQGGRSVSLTGFRRMAIPAFSLLTSLLLGQHFGDVTCGFRAYRLALLDDSRIDLDQEWLDRYELE